MKLNNRGIELFASIDEDGLDFLIEVATRLEKDLIPEMKDMATFTIDRLIKIREEGIDRNGSQTK